MIREGDQVWISDSVHSFTVVGIRRDSEIVDSSFVLRPLNSDDNHLQDSNESKKAKHVKGSNVWHRKTFELSQKEILELKRNHNKKLKQLRKIPGIKSVALHEGNVSDSSDIDIVGHKDRVQQAVNNLYNFIHRAQSSNTRMKKCQGIDDERPKNGKGIDKTKVQCRKCPIVLVVSPPDDSSMWELKYFKYWGVNNPMTFNLSTHEKAHFNGDPEKKLFLLALAPSKIKNIHLDRELTNNELPLFIKRLDLNGIMSLKSPTFFTRITEIILQQCPSFQNDLLCHYKLSAQFGKHFLSHNRKRLIFNPDVGEKNVRLVFTQIVESSKHTIRYSGFFLRACVFDSILKRNFFITMSPELHLTFPETNVVRFSVVHEVDVLDFQVVFSYKIKHSDEKLENIFSCLRQIWDNISENSSRNSPLNYDQLHVISQGPLKIHIESLKDDRFLLKFVDVISSFQFFESSLPMNSYFELSLRNRFPKSSEQDEKTHEISLKLDAGSIHKSTLTHEIQSCFSLSREFLGMIKLR